MWIFFQEILNSSVSACSFGSLGPWGFQPSTPENALTGKGWSSGWMCLSHVTAWQPCPWELSAGVCSTSLLKKMVKWAHYLLLFFIGCHITLDNSTLLPLYLFEAFPPAVCVPSIMVILPITHYNIWFHILPEVIKHFLISKCCFVVQWLQVVLADMSSLTGALDTALTWCCCHCFPFPFFFPSTVITCHIFASSKIKSSEFWHCRFWRNAYQPPQPES